MSKTMLYKCPGPHALHGGHFDYAIVADEEVEAKIAEGWHLTTTEAKAAHDLDSALVASHAQAATKPAEPKAADLSDLTGDAPRATLTRKR